MADLQALVWYPEKRLYDASKNAEEAQESYDDEEAPDYANAAEKLARSQGVSDADIRRAKAARPGAGGARSGAVGTNGTSVKREGFDRAERQRFLARRIIHGLRSDRASGAQSSRPYNRGSGGNGKGVRVLGKPSLAKFTFSDRTSANTLNAAGFATPTMFEVDAATFAPDFQAAIQASKDSGKYGAAVYVYPEQTTATETGYADMRLFMTQDGKAGFAIKGGRDIVSVFSSGDHKGSVHGMLELAIQEGGRTLDAFDTVLPELYSVHGFKITGRLKWNDKYAPDGWSKDTFKKFTGGEPDVVYMALDVDYMGGPSPADGIVYDDPDAADAANVAAVNAPDPDPFVAQGDTDAPRGGFSPADLIPDQDGESVNLIQIFEKADPTTFLHESGHFWLEMLKSDAFTIGGQFQKDFDIVTNWWGNRSLEIKDEAIRRAKKKKNTEAVAVLEQMSDAQVKKYISRGDLRGEADPAARFLSIAMHEQFARGVESYFATGNAPSLALADMFSQFAIWVQGVYRRLTGTDVQFSDEVRGVLDRMLATDEEISIAEGQYDMAALFDTPERAGMSPERFTAYQKEVKRRADASRAAQMAKHQADAQRARNKWWKEERQKYEQEAIDEVKQREAYRLLYTLATGGQADGSQPPVNERLGKINRKLLQPYMDELGITEDDLPKVGNTKITGIGDTLADPGIAAQTFGFVDVKDMLQTLVALPKYEDAVQAQIDLRMSEEYGSMDLQGQEEAVASIHGDHTAKVMATELDALRTTEPAFKLSFIRAYARNKLNKVSVKDVKPTRYLAAERRSARLAAEAIAKGDRVAAYRHQFQRLVNHYLAHEAIRADKALKDQRSYLKDFQNPKRKYPGIKASYVDRIKQIVEATDFGSKVSERRRFIIELKTLNEFVQAAQEEDGAVFSLPQWLIDKDALTNMQDMTYGQFSEMYALVKNVEKQGRLAMKLRRGQETRSKAETIAGMRAALAGKSTALTNRFRADFVTPSGGVEFQPAMHAGLAALTELDASLLKIEFLLEAIDGKPLGEWHQALYQPFSDAYGRSNELLKDVSALIEEKMAAMPADVRKNLGKRVDLGALGTPDLKFTRSNLIMIALNTGNEGNLQKLVEGYEKVEWNISEDLIDAAVQKLTKEEMDFVQAIWDHAEKLWPSVDAIYREEQGVSPARVEARTISTPHGDYKGGYFPMIYDNSYPSGAAAARNQKRTALEEMQSRHGQATLNSSMTKGRTGYSAPVVLDIARLTDGFNTAIHYITHYDAVRNAKKIMSDEELRADLERVVGKAYAAEIDNWIAAIAANRGDMAPLSRLEKSVDALVRNTTVAALAYSYTTLAAQTFGLTTAYDRLLKDAGYGPVNAAKMGRYLLSALKQAATPSQVNAAFDASIELRNRLENTDRDIRANLLRMKGKTGKFNKFLEGGMLSIGMLQVYTVDVPTWIAAYNYAAKEIAPGASAADRARAVRYADRVVRMSQSSGALKDLSATQRKRGVVRAGTMFYTFFSALYAILRGIGSDLVGDITKKPMAASMEAATRVFIVVTLQEMASALIRGKLPDWEPDEEDEDGMALFALKATATGMVGTIPFVRDIVSGMFSDYGYSGSPLSMFGESVSKATKELGDVLDEDVDQGILDASTLKPVIIIAGVLTGKVPSVQTNRILDGMQALWDDEDEWRWYDIIRGYSDAIAEKR
jgi:hypothetical protein